jgi:hypothetical protein
MSEPPPERNALPRLIPAARAALPEDESATGGLRRLISGVLSAAGQLKPVAIEALLARSGLRLRSTA